MASGNFRFERFVLDPIDRQLRRDDAPVELSARYLDALILLVREQGKLVSKERFLEEVWRGVPVTDEALTQCIKTLRRQLGDDAARPRFIETAPKHGYRFIAPVTWAERGAETPHAEQPSRKVWQTGAAGTLGGGVAGLIGGLIYGLAGASTGIGAASSGLVLIAITMLIGLLGGAGVSFGIATAGYAPGRLGQWCVLGGALGGLVVGGLVKMIGLDAFNLLVGQTPGEITGGPEGAVLGGGVGLAVWFSRGGVSLRRGVATAGAIGAAAGVLIHLLGGRLMAGSLQVLAERFPNSRLSFDQIGRLFGESEFGPISQAVFGGLEGLLFTACIVAALLFAQRRAS